MDFFDHDDGLLRLAWRVLAWFFKQLVLDILLGLPGYLLVKLCSRGGAGDPDPDSFLVLAVGALFWIVAGAAVFFALTAYGVSR